MEDKLREDFPIDWADDDYVSRREFVKFVTLASGGLALGSTALAAWSSLKRSNRSFETVKIAAVTDMKDGEALYFSYPRPADPCVLLRLSGKKFVAYSRRCTHLSCPVEFQPDKRRLYCPCHNGAFDMVDGHVLQGPPPRPLVQIELKIEQGNVFATGVSSI